MNTKSFVVSLPVVALALVSLFGVTSTQAACSSSDTAKTCSQSEDDACTSTYSSCVATAAASADRVACQKCVDDYCACYSKCGNTCDKQKLAGQCA